MRQHNDDWSDDRFSPDGDEPEVTENAADTGEALPDISLDSDDTDDKSVPENWSDEYLDGHGVGDNDAPETDVDIDALVDSWAAVDATDHADRDTDNAPSGADTVEDDSGLYDGSDDIDFDRDNLDDRADALTPDGQPLVENDLDSATAHDEQDSVEQDAVFEDADSTDDTTFMNAVWSDDGGPHVEPDSLDDQETAPQDDTATDEHDAVVFGPVNNPALDDADATEDYDSMGESDPAFGDYDETYGEDDTAVTEAITATAAVEDDDPIVSTDERPMTRREIRELEREREEENPSFEDVAGFAELPKDEDDQPVKDKPLLKRLIAVATVLLVAVGVGAGTYWLLEHRPWEPSTAEVPVAQSMIQMGTEFDAVCEPFGDAGLSCGVVLEATDEAPRGELLSQSINAGQEVEIGTEIDLTYSNGPARSEFPNLRNDTVEEAEETLYNMNIVVAEIEEVDNSGLEPGRIVETSIEPGEVVTNGDEVVLQVSSGTVEIPDWTGEPRDQVSADADALGLNVEFIQEESDETAGTVLEQSPEAGEANTAQVQVTIATPREQVELEVPDIIGASGDEAVASLTAEGFLQVNTVTVTNSQVSEEEVTQVVPGVGQTADSGENIVVIVSTPETSDDD